MELDGLEQPRVVDVPSGDLPGQPGVVVLLRARAVVDHAELLRVVDDRDEAQVRARGVVAPDLLQDVGDVQPDVTLGVAPARVAPREALAHLRVGHELALEVVLGDEPREGLLDHGQLRWAVRTARTSAANASTSSSVVSHAHIQRTSPVCSSQT